MKLIMNLCMLLVLAKLGKAVWTPPPKNIGERILNPMKKMDKEAEGKCLIWLNWETLE